jgi:hypothetical protein
MRRAGWQRVDGIAACREASRKVKGRDRSRKGDRPGGGQAASGRLDRQSLMLAMRRRIKPCSSNSQFSLP